MDEKNKKPKEFQISINLDTTPVYYTDNINMTANANGVVLNVIQALGPTNQVRIVSRIGMSREHAKKFVEKLGKLLLVTEGKVQTGSELN